MAYQFHPAVQQWFDSEFSQATPVQQQAWPQIGNGRHCLVAAPTGSGKTLAAFLAAIDRLVQAAQQRPLQDQVYILYISPLKALSNDIERNLQEPLAGIDQYLARQGGKTSGIRAMVRTGDTPPGEREKMRRQPPHILVTTPESLYILLTSDSGRGMLGRVETVIVDEIHSVVGNKRGAHLSLSLARLQALQAEPPQRVGLSATQKPIETVADFLTGGEDCRIIDTGHRRDWDLRLELPDSPLSPVMANEVWEEVYNRLEQLIEAHRTTLIFVNNRRLAERAARHLGERIGEDLVTSHHGSLARKHRLHAEQRLKAGQLRALVATASLELGIDIGHVDLVCQLGSPRAISTLLQRIGRAGHGVGQVSKGRLFPLSRDDLVECTALLDAVQRGELDQLQIRHQPLDVLAQQVVAELAARDWEVDRLHALLQRAWPYRNLSREHFLEVVQMLSEGFTTRRGRRGAMIYYDAVNGRLKGRPNARLKSLMNGGAIPDQFDYDVILQPAGQYIGSLNEDFAFESLPGDIFQLGNTSYQILKVEQGKVLVADAHGQPPNIPFWFGDAPGRSDALSAAVSRMRERMDEELGSATPEQVTRAWADRLEQEPAALSQLVEYLAAARAVLQQLPTQKHVVLERFFDETGDMHLVLHAPFGSRLNRAWGLALRKRFCRKFNFELQAAALEDCLILSLGETHSFQLAEVMQYLNSASVKDVLTQALLDAPMFEARWRWNATIALAVARMRNGKKVPAPFQRAAAQDLIAVVFPDQLACLENIQGAREIPDHPLVRQTIDDCLYQTMDLQGLMMVLEQLEQQQLQFSCHDLNGPSPLSQEVINAKPYAFLDNTPAEERRTLAINSGRDAALADIGRLARVRVPAVEQVRQEAWIAPRNADELHDGLLQLGFLTAGEVDSGCSSSGAQGESGRWGRMFQQLAEEQRATRLILPSGHWCWVAAERLLEAQAVWGDEDIEQTPLISPWGEPPESMETALVELLRGRLSGSGPISLKQLCADFCLPESRLLTAMAALENDGYAMRSDLGLGDVEYWCERRLLARIHRYSRNQRRAQVRPVSPEAYIRFLFHWHGLNEAMTGEAALSHSLDQLQGWGAPLAAWEQQLLSMRVSAADGLGLDARFLNGEFAWFRRGDPVSELAAAGPIVICRRGHLDAWRNAAPPLDELSSTAQQLLNLLENKGANFAADLAREAGLLEPQLEQALEELVGKGIATADSISALRNLLRNEQQKRRQARWRGRGMAHSQLIGRWSLLPPVVANPGIEAETAAIDHHCRVLLKRYGVVFRRVIQREQGLPPWRALLYHLRRLEDRGEVLGGRFVDGFSGEQFALKEAAAALRQAKKPSPELGFISINGCDPLNLAGIITPDSKVPARLSNQLLWLDGRLAGVRLGDEIRVLETSRNIDNSLIYQKLGVVMPISWKSG